MELKTNLTEQDYQDLLFDNYIAKSIESRESYNLKKRNTSSKEKLFHTEINGKRYDGAIVSYPIDLDWGIREDEQWIRQINAVFKVKLILNFETFMELSKDYFFIDGRKYYTATQNIRNTQKIICYFISYDSFESNKYVEI